MGAACTSVKFESRENVGGQDKESLDIIYKLKFSPSDIDKLFAVFKKCDTDNSESIMAPEMFAYYTVELTKFNKKIFTIFDEDGSGEINFLEFVCSHWNFLTLRKEDLGVMAFLMCDSTGQRAMELPELRNIVELCHSKPIDAIPAVRHCFDELFKNFTGRFLFEEFVKWTAANPVIVAPLHILQVNIRSKLLGENFWAAKQEQRYADPQMKQPRYIFQFHAIIRKIHAKNHRDMEMKRLSDELAKVRGYTATGGKDRKQNDVMEKLGLGEKKVQRKGANMPGDLDVAIRTGNDEILAAEIKDSKESGKVRTKTTVVSADGAAAVAAKVSRKSGRGTVIVSSAKIAPTASPMELEKGLDASQADKSLTSADTSVESKPNKSRKTIVLPPIQGGGAAAGATGATTAPPVEVATAGAVASGAANSRKGRSTFVKKS